MKIGTRIIRFLLSTLLCVAGVVLVNTPQNTRAKSELTTTFTNDAGQWWAPINGKTIGDAREALDNLKAKIKARDEAKAKLEEARGKLSTALAAIAMSGGKQTPSQTKQLKDLKDDVAKAEAALEKAEAELLAARVALEKAISELPDGADKDELKRERDYLYSVAFPQKQVLAANEQSSVTDTLSGIVTVEMKTDQGPIMLRLPADMRAGDTISGSVVDGRKGPTDEVTAVEINGQSHKLSNKMLTFVVPKTGQIYSFIAKNGSGREIARGQLPKEFAGNLLSHNAFPTVGSNVNGQTGRNLPLAGKFDGVAGTTNATIGGRPAEIVAESQTLTVIGISADTPAGQSTLSLKETGGNSTSNFQSDIAIVSVKLKADNLTLTRGQQALATMTVDIGQNPKAMVPVQISCSGAVNMQGGNLQTIRIQPSQVSSDGTFTQTFSLTATQAGTFNVRATVTQPNPTTGKSECKCKCEFATPPIVTAGTRTAVGGGNENSFEPNINTGCNGNKCEVQSITYSWSVGAGSTATYSVHAGSDKVKKLVVDVTKSGTLELTVTVTVTCSDGSTCTDTATKTFDVKK